MKYYMAGIKGAGMSALALLLSDLGYEIVGYDDDKTHKYTEDKLISRGIKILNTHNNELDSDTVVIHSIALNEEHPEIVDKILLEGTLKAQKTAKETMKKVKKAMKLDYFE